jgi:hypothetical protein
MPEVDHAGEALFFKLACRVAGNDPTLTPDNIALTFWETGFSASHLNSTVGKLLRMASKPVA